MTFSIITVTYNAAQWIERTISQTYSNIEYIIIDGNSTSPYLYISNINQLKGKTLLDIGTAEGIFTLEAIELINHAYLFECDDMWRAALNTTIEPWEEKITIIPKYVNDINDKKNITSERVLSEEKIEN